MIVFDIILSGVVLGGIYALLGIGLTLQYGIARILNLAYGEFVIVAALLVFWLFTKAQINPLLALIVVVPLSFAANWGLYRYMLLPLVRRAKSFGQLEADSILATFGLLFVIQGIVYLLFGGQYYSYDFLSVPLNIFGAIVPLNRVIALALATVIGLGLYVFLTQSRLGTSIRAVSVDPIAARLVAIDVQTTSALTFALGGTIVGAAGILVSMFQTLNAAMGVIFTMKALIVVIVGGPGNVVGALVVGLALGIVETAVARLIDPGLTLAVTYALFMLCLLIRPQGLFARAGR